MSLQFHGSKCVSVGFVQQCALLNLIPLITKTLIFIKLTYGHISIKCLLLPAAMNVVKSGCFCTSLILNWKM